jgi:hypothetical protein
MSFLRAAIAEVVGLFVGDWVQSLVTVAILAAGWAALPRLQVGGLAFVVAAALAIQLVAATILDARRMSKSAAAD